MLILSSTSDKIRLITSGSCSIHVQSSYSDKSSAGVISLDRKNTLITTGATTDIVASPGASVTRNVKHLSVRAEYTSATVSVTVVHTDGTTAVEIFKASLAPNEHLVYDGETGFAVHDTNGHIRHASLARSMTVSAYNNANISIANNTLQTLTFNVNREDLLSMHSTGSNTDKFYAIYAGWYLCFCNIRFAANGTGYRQAFFEKNGALSSAFGAFIITPAPAAVPSDGILVGRVYLAAGDYVTVVVAHNIGAALNVEYTSGNAISPEFTMFRTH